MARFEMELPNDLIKTFDRLNEETEKMIARQKYEQSRITHHSNTIFLARTMERRRKKRYR